MQLTNHFSVEDFAFKPWRHLRYTPYPYVSTILLELCRHLEVLRDYAPTMILQYGYRPREFHEANGTVGKSGSNAHEQGIAADLIIGSELYRMRVDQALKDLPLIHRWRGPYLHVQLLQP